MNPLQSAYVNFVRSLYGKLCPGDPKPSPGDGPMKSPGEGSLKPYPELLCTEALLNSGVVDVLWGNHWRAPTVKDLVLAQHMNDHEPGISLPERGVIVCFISHLRDTLARIQADRPDGKYILIVREGDPSLSITEWPDFIHHVFSTNSPYANDRVTPMPMAFHAFASAEFTRDLPAAMALPRKKTNRVLASFSVDTGGVTGRDGHERMQVIERFRDVPWVTMNEQLCTRQPGQGVNSPWPHLEYVALLREHDYVFVPMGYGVERIAQWEAMVLGTIPICKRHAELDHFADMPIAFVDDWSEVTEAWCDANLDIIARPMQKLRLDYWVDQIRQKRVEIGLS